MSTTTRRAPRAHKASNLPFSATAAKLIEQIQAEARTKLLEDLSAKDAIIVLHGFDAETRRVRATGDFISVRDDKGNYVRMHRNHTEPESWRGHAHMAGLWHPARWHGQQTLVDASGAEWERELPTMVCNDFRDLVEVSK